MSIPASQVVPDLRAALKNSGVGSDGGGVGATAFRSGASDVAASTGISIGAVGAPGMDEVVVDIGIHTPPVPRAHGRSVYARKPPPRSDREQTIRIARLPSTRHELGQ